jgi:hypothetical protein
MKAISLWQPWASAVAMRAKRIETRSWSTCYRGPLAIHAAKRCVKSELIDLFSQKHWQVALRIWPSERELYPKVLPWEILPFGAIVATCRLADCVPSARFGLLALDNPYITTDGYWTERQMGNFGPGRWAWLLNDVRPLARPIPYRGSRGLFDVPDALLKREAP